MGEPPTQAIKSLPVKFKAGDRVHVRRLFPLGHVRTPWYIRGCSGIVERICGAYPNPEELAYRRSGLPAQPLYRVRFLQRDVWFAYRGGAKDTVDLEIYQHWLEESVTSDDAPAATSGHLPTKRREDVLPS